MPLRVRKEVQARLKSSLDDASVPAVARPALPPPAPSQDAEEAAAAIVAAMAETVGVKQQSRPSRKRQQPAAPAARRARKRKLAPARAARSSRRKARKPGKAVGHVDLAAYAKTVGALFDVLILHSSEPDRLVALKVLTERYLSTDLTLAKIEQVKILLLRQAEIVRRQREAAPTIHVAPAQPAGLADAAEPETPTVQPATRRAEPTPEAEPVPPAQPSPPPARRRLLSWRRLYGSGDGGGGGPRLPVLRRLRTAAMASIWLGVGGVTIAYAASLAYVNVMRIETDTAIVTGAVEPVFAPLDGSITTMMVKPGDRVSAGQRLLLLQDPEVERQVRLAGVRVERAREEFRQKQAALEAEKTRRDEYVAVARNTIERLDAEIDALARMEATARERLERLTELFKKGLVIRPRLEEASDKLAQLTAQLDKARITRRERAAQLDTADAGSYFDGRLMKSRVQEAEAAVARASSEIDLALEELQAWQQRRLVNRVEAAHDARVLKVMRGEGAAVRRGDAMLVLERQDQRLLHAFLRQEEASRVTLGDEVKVFLPAIRAATTARVAQIERNGAFLDDIDARYSWRTARDGGPKPTDKDRTARVTLKFDPDDARLLEEQVEIGTPAVVSFPRRSVGSVFGGFAALGERR